MIALGVGAAWTHSTVAFFPPGPFPPTTKSHQSVGEVYFEAAAAIVVRALLGQVPKLRARADPSSAIRALLNLAPPTALRVTDRADVEVALAAAASLDRSSEHPFAAALVPAAAAKGLALREVSGFRPVTSRGVARIVAGKTVLVGQEWFLAAEGVPADPVLQEMAARLQADATTVLSVALAGKAAGLLARADLIKDSTAEAITILHELGVKQPVLHPWPQAAGREEMPSVTEEHPPSESRRGPALRIDAELTRLGVLLIRGKTAVGLSLPHEYPSRFT